MRPNITRYILSVFIISILTACGSRKDVDMESEVRLPKVKDEVLINRLDSLSKQRPDYFYTKLKSKYSDSQYNVSFKTSIRMRSDSALHALITFARIPIYNTMVTPDTLTMVDKRNNCYIQEGMEYLKSTFGVDFQHKNIEELILGLPIAWDSNLEYHQIKDPYNYVVSSRPKRTLMMRQSEKEKVNIRYLLTEDTKSIKTMYVESPKDSTSIVINYFGREMVNGFSIPLEGDIKVETPKEEIFIDFKYNKTTVNEPRVLYLAIPNRYDRCE